MSYARALFVAQIIPVDLNVYLYDMEVNIAQFAVVLTKP